MNESCRIETGGEARRNITVSMHKAGQIAGSLVTIMVVPRMLGPDDYGRFVFILTLSYLGQIIGDFGALDIFGYFIPRMGDTARKRLYMHMLIFKIVLGILCGATVVAAALIAAAWMRWDWAWLAGTAVALHIVSWVPFQFALGLSRIGIWMMEQAWRQWILLAGLLIMFPLLNFSGAVLALVLMEALFCVGGILSVRGDSKISREDFSLKYLFSYLQFGKNFYLANLTAVALFRSGPVLVYSLTKQTVETGFTDIALGFFLLVYVTVSQFAQSLIPVLSKLLATDERQTLRRKLSRFVLAGCMFTSLCSLGTWLLAGHAIPLLLGEAYINVTPSLQWISLAMPLTVLLWAGNVSATIAGRGDVKLRASFSALIVYLASALWLIPRFHSVGIALALILAMLAAVVVLARNLWSEGLWHCQAKGSQP